MSGVACISAIVVTVLLDRGTVILFTTGMALSEEAGVEARR